MTPLHFFLIGKSCSLFPSNRLLVYIFAIELNCTVYWAQNILCQGNEGEILGKS